MAGVIRDSVTPSVSNARRIYEDAETWLHGLITGQATPPADTPPSVIRERAVQRLAHIRAFLSFIGSPQDQYRTIHITGTSGKGSTAVMTASILAEMGLRVGCHVSPYLQVATEKLQINGRLISAERYGRLVETIRAPAERWTELGNEPLQYGEAWVAMALLYFAEEGVDYAVVEVGAGGRFDLTNVIQPDVAAITSVGLDHVVTLGPTIEDIAWHKAGIIKSGALAVTAVTDQRLLEIIEREAIEQEAPLQVVTEGDDYRDVETGPTGTSFTDTRSGRRFSTPLSGAFQATNAALATAITRGLPALRVTDEDIQRGLAAVRFPGRMEIVQRQPLVLLDGAHNPQKTGGLQENLRKIAGERRIICVFGVLETKGFQPMLDQLLPDVSTLVATAPQVYAKPPVEAAQIAAYASGKVRDVFMEPEPLSALVKALSEAGPNDMILVTGSLYLIGNVREHWYPSEQILVQGTVWPTLAG